MSINGLLSLKEKAIGYALAAITFCNSKIAREDVNMSFNNDDNSKSDSQSFSDADLKRYKSFTHLGCVTVKELKALLTRLEASEKLSIYYARHKDFCGLAEITPSYRCELCEAIEAWYKACGK